MNQREKRVYLINELLKERRGSTGNASGDSDDEQKRMLRSLMNMRMAAPISQEFERVQDEYLQELNNERGVVGLEDMTEVQPDTYIWQGDITRLKVGAIVNAANSGMTGCYLPCHNCIDNFIHTYAGVQLRNYCQKIMDEQGCEEPTGQAKITPAFNLPCDYVIHTVGPIVQGELTSEHEELLASSYRNCISIAAENGVESIAFCCISTGVFMFPARRAAEIAIETVEKFKKETGAHIKVVYNVFKDADREIYENLLNIIS